MLDLNPHELETIQAILHRHVPDCEVRAFGSRYRWTAKDYSDLDLAIVGPGPLDLKRIYRLREAFETSDLRFRVDVLDWRAISPEFRKVIEPGYEVMQQAGGSGEMASNGWSLIRLGDACSKIGSGATPRGGGNVYLEHGEIALIRSQNVYNDGFRREGLVYLSKQHADELSNVEVQPNDVLLNITGDSVARCCQVDNSILPARVNQHVSIIRPASEQLDPRFLRYFLVSPLIQNQLLSWAGAGATRNALTKGMIESFEISAPRNVAEQRAIAHFLGALDDKIELNRRMNDTLEAIARALFKAWFVDFEPVRARRGEARPRPMAAHATGATTRVAPTDDDITALFPAEFADSALGQIPMGWKVASIGDMVQVVGGGTPSTKEAAYWEGGTIHWATPKDMAALSSPALLDTERQITELGLQQISSGLLPKGTVLLSSRAPIGYLAIAEVPVAINQGFIAMVCEGELLNHYVLHWTRENMSIIEGRANGTTFLEISKSNFRPIQVVVPSHEIMKRFVEQAEALHQKVIANLKESRTLAALRDALLPKLIGGEMRVV
jgi:type I restriction enzyme S subunit